MALLRPRGRAAGTWRRPTFTNPPCTFAGEAPGRELGSPIPLQTNTSYENVMRPLRRLMT